MIYEKQLHLLNMRSKLWHIESLLWKSHWDIPTIVGSKDKIIRNISKCNIGYTQKQLWDINLHMYDILNSDKVALLLYEVTLV